MKILVTGNAGFIGFHVARRLLERGDAVVGFDVVNDYYDPALKEARLRLTGGGRRSRPPAAMPSSGRTSPIAGPSRRVSPSTGRTG